MFLEKPFLGLDYSFDGRKPVHFRKNRGYGNRKIFENEMPKIAFPGTFKF